MFKVQRTQHVDDYFKEIFSADIFVAIIPMGSLTSVYFEAGYAAALNKRSIYFVPEGSGKVMPSLMAEANLLSDNIRTVPFDSLNSIYRVLTEEYSN